MRKVLFDLGGWNSYSSIFSS